MICYVLSLQGALGIPSTFPTKIICRPVAVLFLHVGKDRSGTQAEPWGCAWPCSPARLGQNHPREPGAAFSVQDRDPFAGSLNPLLLSRRSLWYYSLIIHLIHISGFSVSNPPGSPSRSCIQTDHPTDQFFFLSTCVQ